MHILQIKLSLKFVLVGLMVSIGIRGFANDNIITLGVTSETLKSKPGIFSKRLISKALNRMGYKMRVVAYPAIRLEEQTRAGKTDGELIRVENYGKSRPHLFRVQEHHLEFSIVGYSGKKNFKVFNTSTQVIGYRKGVKVVEELLKESYPRVSPNSFDDTSQALKLLSLNRIHGYIGVDKYTDEILSQLENEFKVKIFKTQILKVSRAHVFLRAPHKTLAKKLSEEIKEMKKTGEYFRILKNSFKKKINN